MSLEEHAKKIIELEQRVKQLEDLLNLNKTSNTVTSSTRPSKSVAMQNITAWPELGINYWGINKNATSTLITHFTDLVYTDKSMIKDKDDKGQEAKKYIKDRYIDKSTALTNGLKNFCITRNPYTRFESCFKQFKYPKNDIHVASLNKADFESQWDANDFLNHIARKFEKGKPGNKHFRLQTWFCPNPSMIHHCIKLEHLNKHWPFDFPAPNFVTNSQPDMNIEYDRELLHRVYNDDFKTFGYKK
jgi:hypothetical protein